MTYKQHSRKLLSVLLIAVLLLAALPASAAVTCTHVWGRWITIDDNACFGPSTRMRRCQLCRLEQTEEFTQPHQFGPGIVTQPATCTQEGRVEWHCKVCGYAIQDTFEKIDHAWSEWLVVMEPAAGEPGWRERSCGMCGLKQREPIYADGMPNSPDGEPDPDAGASGNALLLELLGFYGALDMTPGTLLTGALMATNTGDDAITVCSDSIEDRNGAPAPDDHLGAYPDNAQYLMPGDSFTVALHVVLTEQDIAAGEVVRRITMTAAPWMAGEDDPNTRVPGEPFSSNTVTAYMNLSDAQPSWPPFGVITGLTLVKEEVSAPANGSYYQAGEKIRYRITYTNTGETMLGETLVYDALKADSEIASAEHLYPGETRTCSFDYTVTPADVEVGYVLNIAMAEYSSGGPGSAISNPVVSPTGDGSLPTEFPPELTVDALSAADDVCIPAIVARSSVKHQYSLHCCRAHAATLSAVETMTSAAATPEAKTAAWQYARSLWQRDADEMYQALMSASNSAAKAVVFNEWVLFIAQAANHEAALNALLPDAPARVMQRIAEMYMNRCLELCYALHTAPQDRADSLLLAVCGDDAGEAASACVLSVERAGNADLRYQELLCASHGLTSVVANTLLASGDTEAAWRQVETIWQTELQQRIKALKRTADESTCQLLTADARMYAQWLDARRELLRLLYPEKEQITAQMIAREVMSRVLSWCAEE